MELAVGKRELVESVWIRDWRFWERGYLGYRIAIDSKGYY